MELTARQMQVLERLFAAGFRPIAIPPYESALCLRRGECVAVLAPVAQSGLRVLAPASFLLDGHLSVKVKRGERELFVFKEKELEATPELTKELAAFDQALAEILAEGPAQ
jgi:hypothetical protein